MGFYIEHSRPLFFPKYQLGVHLHQVFIKELSMRSIMTTAMLLLVGLLLLATGCKSNGSGIGKQSASTWTPSAGTMIVHPADGALMVYVPAGEFIMGMDRQEADALAKSMGYANYEKIAAYEWFPRRAEHTQGYFIDVHEVTNERWARFVSDTSHENAWRAAKQPALTADDHENAYALYPVVRVLWGEAQQYANWAGKALPTEKEWEKAARGTDGRVFPWGNEPLSHDLGVLVQLENDKPTHYQMVGSKPAGASPYGCMDMAGNVYEWTSQWHEPYMNNPEAHRMTSYMGHKAGCLRGGSFYHAKHAFISAKRFGLDPTQTYYHIGFRTVWQPPADYFSSDDYVKAKAAVESRQQELEALRTQGRTEPPSRF